MGKQPHDIVKKVLLKAHIFCLASMSSADGNMEGLPVAILEAQAMGLPIVSTNHSGIPEGVIEGETAVLANEGDVEDFGR